MKRKRPSDQLKTKVALAALKAQSTNNEIASEFGVHTCRGEPMEETGHRRNSWRL